MQLPANEAERLAELRDYRILDTPPEAAFDDLARVAAQICGAPIGAVTFVDAERVWAKAQVGLAVGEMPRGCSLCARAILKPGVFVVEDLAADPELAAHPLAGAEAGIRFFAGAPLVSPNGYALGALCVLDWAPRRLTPPQEEALQVLGRQVITHLELRRNLRKLEQSVAGHEQSEAALREAEAKYRSIFENVNEGIYQTTAAGQWLAANPKLAQILGYDSPAQLMAAMRDIEHQLYVEPSRRAEFLRLMQLHNEVAGFESQVHRRDGQIIWITENARTVRDAHGRVLCYEGTIQDITEHKRAEDALRDSELLYHSLVECLPQNIFRKDTAGRFTFVNQRFCQTVGRTQEEILGKTDLDFFPPELAGKYQADDRRVMRTGTVFDTVEEHVRPSGERLFVQVLKTPLYDGTGKVIGVQGIFWDVTERRRIEAALARERDLLRALLDNVPDAIYFKDAQSRFVRCSRALAAKFGLSDPAQLTGKTDFDFFTEEHARPAFEDEQRIIRTGQPVVGLAEKETLPDGRVGWVLTSKLPLRNEQGEIVGTFGISKDITPRIQAEQELAKARDLAVESTRLKSEFLANMSHELRTPMNAVIGMTGLLLDTELTAEQRECVETVRSSADALLGIINDILDFSKIEAGRMQLEVVDFDLREAVEGTVELLAESAQRKGLELVYWVEERLPARLRGDPGRLRQVLTNLLGNAIKFTARGEVCLRLAVAAESPARVRVRGEVKDTGIGVSKDAQTRIFEAFSQADGSTTRYGGTGLGLAISKQLVELMGGRIGVESEAGAGSTFWFELELATVAGAQPQAPAPRESLAGLRVLVVDDNASNRRILLHQLGRWQMQPAEAASGPEALDRLRAAARAGTAYELAILDMQMPEMDGLALAKAIRADARLARTCLVMLTSLGCRLGPDELRAGGIAACLVKPVRQSRLHDTLANALAGVAALPPGAAGPGAAGLAGGAGPAPPARAWRVLVAEDNVVNQKLAVRQLGKLGHHAEAVANGQEVLAALQQAPYDVLLLDCQMPELDGYETARRIRRREAQGGVGPGAKPPLRIIAMTAHALAGERDRCLAAGMDDYLSKPVRLEDLRAALERALAQLPPAPAAAPATAPAEDETRLDLDTLRALRALSAPGQPDLVAELVGLFLASAEPLLERMKTALARNEAPALKAAAHSLKGSANNLGARRLAGLCARVEAGAATGALTDAASMVEELGDEFARVRAALLAQRDRQA
jgi:PAS domain S-box-containing protein